MKNSPENLLNLLSLSSPKIAKIFSPIYDFLLTSTELTETIKDNYATFSSTNGTVAVVYPNKNFIDVLLALPFDKSDKVLFNAVDFDYKWRNLSSGVRITSSTTAKHALVRLKEAKRLVDAGMIEEQDGAVFARPKAAFQPAFKKELRHR